MGTKMLIDASQPEETRVVVARGSKLEEFDFESASKKPLKGNIYLAKVTRVEPSLQAAFVEYGGNRHGFLAFAEIHPDYYQIPIADRMALLAEEEAEAEHDHDEEDDHPSQSSNGHGQDHDQHDHGEGHQHNHDDASENHGPESEGDTSSSEPNDIAMAAAPEASISSEPVAESNEESEARANPDEAPASPASGELEVVDAGAESHHVETMGDEDALEEVPQRQQRRQPRRKHYKIQEVIKRRQILLVQVIKEERGNKGAALTTYLSLAGRYCVLMPNTARGGGISRKITDASDRRRLKEVAKDVEVPKGMGVIVRTAGAQRTRPEIKRDFDYLMRLWESVRELTLKSTAPCLVYEEGNLIKRSIRDLYTKDVEEIQVDGEAAYREAKDFMKMLMPSHAKNVKLYKDPKPLFQRFQVETHLDALYSPTVTLPSGGYLVINQTEALVSIDINSGKATREHNIEDTATKTNLEACDEIARQLRLRDLAGLVVIDFIDMEENRNNRAVERRMKEALKNDRARIQVGRISHFGLLEMSRQRLRPGLLEGSFKPCPHCEGRGIVRSVSSCGLGVLRSIEEYLQKGRSDNLTVKCARDVAFYLLNEKRDSLLVLEQAYGISIFLTPGGEDVRGTQAIIERAPDREKIQRKISAAPVKMDSAFTEEAEEEIIEEDVAEADVEAASEPAESVSAEETERREGANRKRRRRGRRGGKRGDQMMDQQSSAAGDQDQDGEENGEISELNGADSENQADEASEGQDAAPNNGAEQANGHGGERGRGRNRRNRGRFGRDRERNDGDNNRRERPERAAREDTNGAHEQDVAVEARPAPIVINIPDVIPDPEPRKWVPPAPTVTVAPTERKGGWWSKRK